MDSNVEQDIYRIFVEMAERKQDFLVDSSFLVQELMRNGYQAPFEELQEVAGRIYTKLQEHPEIVAMPLHDGLGPRL